MSQEKVEHWTREMEKLSQSSPDLAQVVEEFWNNLRNKFPLGSLPYPVTSLHKDETYVVIWENPKHYLDIEIYQNGKLNYFYRARELRDFEMKSCAMNNCEELVKLMNNFTE